MKKLIKAVYNKLLGVHPRNTILSWNWLYVHRILSWYRKYNYLFKDCVAVDYGAGDSPYSYLIYDKLNKYYALDFFNEPQLKGKLEQINLNSDGSIPDNFKERADIVISNQVLMEVDNHNQYFNEISKITKKDSLVFITAPFVQALGNNDSLRVSPFYIFKKLKEIGFEITNYESAGYFFSGMALTFNMLLVLKNRYDYKTSFAKVSAIKSIIFLPLILLVNILSLVMDKIFPLYRCPSNFLIIAKKLN